MFEHRSQPVIPRPEFAKRLLNTFLVSLAIVAVSLLIGTSGYYWFVHMRLDETFHHTSLMLSGHDVSPRETTTEGHLFAGIFVLYSRLIFVSLVAIFVIPLLHRILHKLNLDT